MWAVDREVDDSGRSPIIDRIVGRWPHDAGSARFFRSSANFLARFQQNGRPYFLRFADSTERDRAQIEAELDLVRWLGEHGFVVSMPELSVGGAFVESVEVGDRTFHAVVFAGLTGAQFDSDELDDAGFRRWGQALGSLHMALKAYPNSTSANRRTWRDDLDFIERAIPPDAVEVWTELRSLQAELDALPTDPDLMGLIHFDFELDNLVWSNDSVEMLDFDDCAMYWYSADIAFALRDLFDAGRSQNDPSVRAFLDGYTVRTALDERMATVIPIFSRMSRLLTYARIVRSLDIDPGQDYPDWLTGLATRLRDHSNAYRGTLIG